MSQPALNQTNSTETIDAQWRKLSMAGGVAALIQLACVVITIIVGTIAGAEPSTAEEYFTVLQHDGLLGVLRLDFATLLLICLFTITPFGILAGLRRSYPVYAALATALIYVGTILALANHSAFSMIRLSDLFATASSAAQQDQLLAAGEAVIASDMWNTTAGFLAGIFMQGAFVFISVVMLRSKEFSKGTAVTGLFANGFDLVHVFVALFAPALGTIFLYISGPFYLIWFPLLGRDLIRYARGIPGKS
ncbi:MAG: hypothetical protein GY759_22025 [Chloroflexi bacterium]|nr:hypothetical protein [Chloroflexota bacterium]